MAGVRFECLCVCVLHVKVFVCEREFQNMNLLPCDVDMREFRLLLAWRALADHFRADGWIDECTGRKKEI